MEGAHLRFTQSGSNLMHCPTSCGNENGCPCTSLDHETIMLDVMYDLPTIEGSVEVVISAGVVKGKAKAKINPIEAEKLDAA